MSRPITREFTAYETNAARGWLADCEWEDVSPADIYQMPASVIWRAVERHYDGGIEQFLIDAEPVV